MTDNGRVIEAVVADGCLAVLQEIENLEEMIRAHRGLYDCDEAIAWLDLTLGAALAERRRRLARLRAV